MHHCAGLNAIVTSSWGCKTFAHEIHLFHFDGFEQIQSFIIGSSMLHGAIKPGYVRLGKISPVMNEDLHGSPIAQVLIAIHAHVNAEQGDS